MTCPRSRNNWHSYVKKSLSAAELQDMETHLEQCATCREIVSDIRETTNLLASVRVNLEPPTDIRVNVMKAIDKTKYKKENHFSRLMQSVRLLGFSLVATGFLLLALNLNPAVYRLENVSIAEVNFQIGKIIALPFDNFGQTVSVVIGKLDLFNSVLSNNLSR